MKKTNKQYAWKVVKTSLLDGCLRSVCSPYSIKYTIGKWAIPRKSFPQFLFVFKTRQAARMFKIGGPSSERIYKCEIVNPTTERSEKCCFGYFKSENFNEGTLFVNAVKLLNI